MTIVLGFACKDTLIFASDSQMGLIGDTFKRWDEPKLSSVQFKNHVHAMVGISGVLDSANYFQDIFERRALNAVVESSQDIANVAEESFRETRIKFLEYVDDGVMTLEAKQRHLDSLHFAVLLGCYWQDKPHLFVGDFYHGRLKRSRRPFEAIGCGHNIASFVLAGCDLPSLNFSDGLGVAVYAVEKCKKFDDACGGPVQHLIVNDGWNGYPFSFPPWILDVYARATEALDKKMPQMLISVISEEIKKVADQVSREVAERSKFTPPSPDSWNPSSEPRPSSPKPDPQHPPASPG